MNARVLIVEAHEPTRLGLAFLLQRQPWVERCHLAADSERAVVLAARHRPHVAVVDTATAAPFHRVLAHGLRRVHPTIRLVLTSRSAFLGADAIARACGAAHVPQEAPGSTYVDVVRAAAEGRIGSPRPPRADQDELLTAREREVLSLLSTGATNREIAAVLHLGTDTIKKSATSIYRKLGVRNRTEATQRARELLAG